MPASLSMNGRERKVILNTGQATTTMNSFGCKCRIILSVWLIVLANSAVRTAADTPLRIPAPTGFIDGAPISQKLRTMGLAGQPVSVKLLGLYYPTNALAEILNQGYSAPSPFCKALLKKENSSVAESRKEFQTLVLLCSKNGPG
jgi:hypothetical protein